MSRSNIALGTKAWAERINTSWRRSLESVLETGRILIAAKNELPHGSFTNMIHNELAFSARTAQKIMAIAADERLVKNDSESFLPQEWTILYELTRLSDESLQRAIEQGIIKPDMQRSDVPKESRNLSARPSRPRMIEGTATEVQTEALPMAEPPQPPKPAPPPVALQRIEQSPAYLQANAERQSFSAT